MATHALFPSVWTILGGKLFAPSTEIEARRSDTVNSADYMRAERDCVRDAIWSNPEAFAGELDILALADRFRGKF